MRLKEHSPQGEIEMSSPVGPDPTPCCISARINTFTSLQWCRNNWQGSNSYTHLLKSCQQESVQVWTENRRSAPNSVVIFFPLNIDECKVWSLRSNNWIENCPLRTLKQDLLRTRMWTNQVTDHLNRKKVKLVVGKFLKGLCFSAAPLSLVSHSLPLRQHWKCSAGQIS